MKNSFCSFSNEENDTSRESIEVDAEAVLPLHAQDALRLYGGSRSDVQSSGIHRTSSSTSMDGDDDDDGEPKTISLASGNYGNQFDNSNNGHANGNSYGLVLNTSTGDDSSPPEQLECDEIMGDESHHSLPTPQAAANDLHAITNPSVEASMDFFKSDDQLPQRPWRRYMCVAGCLLLVATAVLIGVLVGTRDKGNNEIEGNKIVIDPENPNELPPTAAPGETDDEQGDDDGSFPYFPPGSGGEDPVASGPLDQTNYCPLNLELNGITITDFNQSIILYGKTTNTSLPGINNNPNATVDKYALPSCNENKEYGHGLWYTIRGPGAVVRASTCQSMGMIWEDAESTGNTGLPLNTQLTVFTSQTPLCADGLICVTANDDSSCGMQSTVSWYAEEDRPYYIFVSGKPQSVTEDDDDAIDNSMVPLLPTGGEPFPVGTFTLTLELAPIGTCDAAIDYESESSAISTLVLDPKRQAKIYKQSSVILGELLGAMIAPDPCVPGEWLGRGGEIWYRITGAGRWIIASTCQGMPANEFPPRIALYKGQCDQLECTVPKASEWAPSVDRDCGFGFSINWWAQDGEEYYIMVYKTNYLPGIEFGLTVEDLNPPVNDNCTGAIELEPDGNVTFGSTLRATYTADQIAPVCQAADTDAEDVTHSHPGVWFKVVGTGSRLTASLCNELTQYDTLISVYEGRCGELTCVTANDLWCGYQSSVNWESTSGVTYYILVHGSTGGTSPSMGDFGLAVFEFQPSVNDYCTDAILLEPGSVTRGSTSAASADDYVDSCDYTGVSSKNNKAPGVWYKVVGRGGGMRASTCGSETTFDTRISIYRGEDCQQLACIISDDNGCGFQSSAYWYAREAETYFILVTGNLFSNFGDFTLHLEEYKPNTINDFCVDAISASSTTVNLGSTKNATFDGVETCVVQNTAPGIWYKIEGTGTGMVVSTCHTVTDFDTRVSVFRGSDCEELECVAGNDDSHQSSECGSSPGSLVSFLTGVGQEYHILVHGWGALSGTFGLTIEEVVPLVSNDFCITARDVAVSVGGSNGTVSKKKITYGTNVDASVNNVPVCGDIESVGHGVWYKAVGTGNRLVASTCNEFVYEGDDSSQATSTLMPGVVTDFDTQLSVFRGSCRTLECVGANNDRCGKQSSVNFFVDAGEAFYVLVHGAENSKGSFGLVLEEIFPQVENDFCDNATPFDMAATGGMLLGTTIEASYDTVAECIVPNTSPGVWYKVVGNGRQISLTTCGPQTNFDTRLSVFTGSCQDLECVTGNDDTSRDSATCGVASTVTWLSVEGKAYFIRVHGWGSLVGSFQLTMSEE